MQTKTRMEVTWLAWIMFSKIAVLNGRTALEVQLCQPSWMWLFTWNPNESMLLGEVGTLHTLFTESDLEETLGHTEVKRAANTEAAFGQRCAISLGNPYLG